MSVYNRVVKEFGDGKNVRGIGNSGRIRQILMDEKYKGIATIKDKDGVVVNENVFESAKEDGQTWTKTKTENVYQSIDQSKLVPLLTKALQEQQATIEALTARIVTLENA